MLRLTKLFTHNYGLRSSGKTTCICIRFNSAIFQEKQEEVGLDSQLQKNSVNGKKVFSNQFSKVQTNDIPSLLNIVASSSKLFDAFQALNILASWNKNKKINFEEDIEKDPNFTNFVSIVEKRANTQHVTEIINALKNLMQLGVPNNNFLIECLLVALTQLVDKKYHLCVLPFYQSLENDLLWNIRRVSIHSLLHILIFQTKHQDTERQKKVVEQTINAIERRWTEVKYPGEFILVYENSQNFDSNLLSHIDDRVVEASVGLSLVELSKVFCSLVPSKRRPTPVLRSLAFHMFKSNEKLSPKQISNVLFTMNALNFPDQALLDKLSSDLLSQIDSIKQPFLIGAILYCMGQMRFRDKALLDALGEWILKNIAICRLSDLRSLILTLATVSYIPSNIDDLIKSCTERFNLTSLNEKCIWIDIIWSLVVLDRASKENVISVLDPSFVKDLLSDDPNNVGTFLKLLNVNAAAEALLQTSVEPKLELSADNLLITQSRQDHSLQVYVHKVLRNFLPPPKYLKENIHTSMGFTVDAEFIIDKNMKPLPLAEFSTNFGEKKSLLPLPAGTFRIALMVWNFKDFTIGSQEITGANNLAVRLLREKGYKVLEIPYFDVNIRDTTVKNIQYFEKRIKEVFDS